jgi:DNA polymerase Ligase (LigD)
MPRFVLLEHQWNGVHWDFMLEVGENLWTWAIDAPIVAGKDLPARRLGEHRSLYLDYEGPVSGDRGSVKRVDSGTYRMLIATDDHVCAIVDGSQLVGEVDLRVTGSASGESVLWIFRMGNVD